MGSRCYIGQIKDGQVEHVYCHSGAYMDVNGEILLKHYTDAGAVDTLIAGGNMSYIDDDGTPSYYGDDDDKAVLMPVEKYEIHKDVMIETWFLFRDGEWHVRSSWHIDGGGDTWFKLAEAVKRPSQ